MRVVVLGGGLQGLACALELSSHPGIEVEVRERASQLGGRARSPSLGGIPFDLGPRAIYRGGPLHRMLRAAGVEPQGFTPPLDGAYVNVAGGLHPLPAGLTDLLRAKFLDARAKREQRVQPRSEEHTSELQSQSNLVCRLLLE